MPLPDVPTGNEAATAWPTIEAPTAGAACADPCATPVEPVDELPPPICTAPLESDAVLRSHLGRNGRKYFDSHYTWDIVESKYLSLIARASQIVRAPDAGPARSKGDAASVS